MYSFGLDPTWHVAENELTFINSFKMKTSVILGVMQMTLGLVVKFSNAFYFRDRLVARSISNWLCYGQHCRPVARSN